MGDCILAVSSGVISVLRTNPMEQMQIAVPLICYNVCGGNDRAKTPLRILGVA